MDNQKNMRSKGRLIITSKFVTIWAMTRGEGGSRQTVTKCDKGGGGSKIGGRPVTYFLNGPLVFWESVPQYAYKRYAYKKNMYRDRKQELGTPVTET